MHNICMDIIIKYIHECTNMELETDPGDYIIASTFPMDRNVSLSLTHFESMVNMTERIYKRYMSF